MANKPLSMITFDDTCKENIKAFNMLEKYCAKAIFFLTIEGIGKKLSEDDVEYIGQLFEIGSHSFSHQDLTSLSIGEAFDHIRRPRDILSSIVGYDIVSFAYPYGRYNRTVIDLVRSSGYRYARTSRQLEFSVDVKRPYEVPASFSDYMPSYRELLWYAGNLSKSRYIFGLFKHKFKETNPYETIKLLVQHALETENNPEILILCLHAELIEKRKSWDIVEDILCLLSNATNFITFREMDRLIWSRR